MQFSLYTLGTILLIAGVAYVCRIAQVPGEWLVGIPVLLLATGLISAGMSMRPQSVEEPVRRR